jgi:hypothetical protein
MIIELSVAEAKAFKRRELYSKSLQYLTAGAMT